LRRFIRVFALTAILAGVFTATASALRFTDEDFNMPPGEVGTPYSFQMTAAAGCPPYKFTILAGALPDGLTLSSDGLISGTPTKLGPASFWVQLVDIGCATHGSAERQFTIDVRTVKVTVDNQILTDAPKGQPYSWNLKAHGGSGTGFTWSLASGTLPAGLALNPAGTIAGTPTANGVSIFVVKATDTNGKSDTKQLSIKVVDPLGVKSSARVAEVGLPFNATLTGTGGTPGYTLSVAGGLPAGLTFSGGTISGTPITRGAFMVAVAIQDADALSSTATVPLTVVAKLAIAAHLSAATVGERYDDRIGIRGGARPFRVRIAHGKLPAGLRLNARTGVLTGTPRIAGTYRFRVLVRDRLGASASKSLVLSVH
jgi:hypothetical protein